MNRVDVLVEPPLNFPSTESEGIQVDLVGPYTQEFIEACWNKAMSRGGRDARDVPIRSFSHYPAIELTYEQDRKSKTNGDNKTANRNGHVGNNRSDNTANAGRRGEDDGVS